MRQRQIQNSFNEDVQARFLDSLSQTGNIEASAAEAGIRRSTVYYKKDRDPEFAEKMHQAKQRACQSVEREIRRRGLEGVSKPVFYHGEIVGSTVEHSDRLLLALARGLMPERYSERNHVTVNQTVTHTDTRQRLAELLNIDPLEGEYTQIGPNDEETDGNTE